MRHDILLKAGMAALLGAACLTAPIAAQACELHVATAQPTASVADEAPFLEENEAAMAKMMTDMHVPPTGDVDADFVAMMIPHHQGAIDMAIAVLRYGKNEQIRRLAQEIIVEQQQEIAAMRLALGQPLPPSGPAPTQPDRPAPTASSETHDHSAMSHGAMSMPMARQ